MVFNLTICGGNITASGEDGAGIGAGPAPGFSGRDGSSNVVNLVISGGIITASGSNAAGIGSGYASLGESVVSSLTISGGNISAAGAGGAGIGSGPTAGRASSVVSRLVIVNGSFDLHASAPYPGIGTQRDTVMIFNGIFDCSAINASACFNSSSLTFQDGNITAITNYQTVGPSSQSQVYGLPSLYFEYLSNSSREELIGIPILHLDAIQLGNLGIYTLTIRQEEANGLARKVVLSRLTPLDTTASLSVRPLPHREVDLDMRASLHFWLRVRMILFTRLLHFILRQSPLRQQLLTRPHEVAPFPQQSLRRQVAR
jgi:hypothetical protein